LPGAIHSEAKSPHPPGIKITTGPTDCRPIKQLFLVEFDAKDWTRFADVSGD
jgi:hypothetical protein